MDTSSHQSQMTQAEVEALRQDFKAAMKQAKLILSGKEYKHGLK